MPHKANPLNLFDLLPALLLATLATTAGLGAEENTDGTPASQRE